MPIEHIIAPLGFEIKKQEIVLPDGRKATMVFIVMPVAQGVTAVVQMEEGDAIRLANGLMGRVISTPNGDIPLASPLQIKQ